MKGLSNYVILALPDQWIWTRTSWLLWKAPLYIWLLKLLKKNPMIIMQIYGNNFLAKNWIMKLLKYWQDELCCRSLGCILYELLVGAPPFCTTSLLQLIRKIRYESVPWPPNLSSDCLNFLQGLLEKDPRHRLTWPYLLQHPFLQGQVLVPPEKRNFTNSYQEWLFYICNYVIELEYRG